jgi:hypothetical protein
MAEEKLHRVTLTRQFSNGAQFQLEAFVSETASAEEIHAIVARGEAVAARLRAKEELAIHLGRMDGLADQIEMLIRQSVEEWPQMGGRGVPMPMSSAQASAARQTGDDLRVCWAQLAGLERAAAECRRMIDGEDPHAVLQKRITGRLDKLRCGSADFPLSPLSEAYWTRPNA